MRRGWGPPPPISSPGGELRDEPAAQKTAALRVALGGSAGVDVGGGVEHPLLNLPAVVTNLGRSFATPFGPFLAGEPPNATQAVLSDRIMV